MQDCTKTLASYPGSYEATKTWQESLVNATAKYCSRIMIYTYYITSVWPEMWLFRVQIYKTL